VAAVSSGGTVRVAAGSYAEGTEYWSIVKSLSLIGAGSGLVTIDRSGSGSYGLHVEADDVTLQGFTFIGPSAVANWAYGLKIAHASHIALQDVTVTGSGRSGIDLNGCSGVSLTDVTVTGNQGAGLALTSCSNVAVTGLVTGGNGWGGVALFTSGSGITITGSQLTWEPSAGVYVQGGTALDYRAFNLSGNTFASNGVHFADLVPGSLDLEDVLGHNTFDRAVVVRTGGEISVPVVFCSIQQAVDCAQPGDTVDVAPGTYREQVVINKDLTLTGRPGAVVEAPDAPATFRLPETSKTLQPVVLAFGGTRYEGNNISGDGTVTVNVAGLTVDGRNLVPTAQRSVGILYRNASGDIEGNTVQNMYVDGKETFGILVYGDSQVHVAQNHVSGWARGGIAACGDFGTSGSGPLPDPVERGHRVRLARDRVVRLRHHRRVHR